MNAKRRPRRFFSEQALSAPDQKILIPAGEARHFHSILRLEPGDEILLSDASGREARASIESYEASGGAWVRVVETANAAEWPEEARICLYVAFAAKGVMDELVEKCQELGVAEFRPMLTERTVVTLSDEKEEKVLDRWYKITREAAKQSGNTRLMEIFKPERILTALTGLKKGDEAVFFHPGQSSQLGWGEQLDQKKRLPREQRRSFNLFLGPEGGFSEKEMNQLEKKARENAVLMTRVHLGPHILRLPTAVVAAVGAAKILLR